MDFHSEIADRFRGKRVTVAGAARSGLAAANLLHRFDINIFVSDSGSLDPVRRNWLEARQIAFEEGGHTDQALDADYIITSPGICANSDLLQNALKRQTPVYSELEMASWFCPAPVVAVTGSNGKTTTTALIGHILSSSGRTTHVAGNIGTPFSEIVLDVLPDDAVVLEVSSFQLEHIKEFHPRVSILLNITPDHMDRYDNDLERYAECKYRITLNQRDSDALIFNMDDAWITSRVAAESDSDRPQQLGFTLTANATAAGFLEDGCLTLNTHDHKEVLMPIDELPIRGRHNASNSLAASIAARMMEIGSEQVRKSLSSFEGIEHRLEFVREVDGVRYVNDSKATNVNALWYALESFQEPIVLIAGGRDKGNDYSSLNSLVKDRVRLLISVGESARKVNRDLGRYAEQSLVADSMEDAVGYASNLARSGETVLLSPACSSFDMFANYEERGEVFKRLISNL